MHFNKYELQNGYTALHRAACFGHFEIVRYLVEECGADVWIRDNVNRDI